MAGSLIPQVLVQQTNENARAISGAAWYFYLTGTTTLAPVYADSGLTTPLTNPVVADSAGRMPNMYGDPTVTYRLVIKSTASGATIRDIDPLTMSLDPSTGATVLSYIAEPANAVPRPVQDKLRERVSLLDFGAVGDGSTDNRVPLNRFFAAVAGGAKGYIPSGTFNFSAALDPVVADNIEVEGDGPNSFLQYTGASTTVDLLTFGNGVDTKQGLSLRKFRVDSLTTMTGGQAVRVKKTLAIDIDLTLGVEYGTWRLYRGIWFDGSTNMRLHSTGVFATNTGVIASDGVELHCMNATVKGTLVGGFGSGVGILVGGGFGGFYAQNLTQLFNEIGLRVDTSITGTGNTQIFLDSGTFDTNKLASVLIDDAVPNAIGKVIRLNGWMASSNGPTGAGLIIENWNSGTVIGGNATLKNFVSSAIYIKDATVRIALGKAVEIAFNGGYGIDSTVAIEIECEASPHDNTLGSFSSNVTVRNTRNGTQRVVQSPSIGFTMDATDSPALTVGNGSNAAIATGSGMVLVSNPGNGDTAIYLLGGNTATRLGSTLGTWVATTTTPTGGNASVAYGSSAYRIYNNTGGSVDFVVVPLVKTRAST